MRRVVAVGLVGVMVAIATGCAEKVAVPAVTAPPDEVVAAFVKASIARDTKVGQELSGECWPDVAGWFNKKRELFTKFTVSPQESPAPWTTDTTVGFSVGVWGESPPYTVFDAKVRRSSPGERWRVCDVRVRGGG